MKQTTLIKGAWLDGLRQNILIGDGRFQSIGVPDGTGADKTIEAGGMAILPAFYNTHTHTPMNLLRGYADDMPLQTWLNDYIWPFEAKMTAGDMVKGSRMAIDEMTHTGTVGFYDMYFHVDGTARVAAQAGMRAIVAETFFKHNIDSIDSYAGILRGWNSQTDGKTLLAVGPHAIYTNDTDSLKRAAAVARDLGAPITIHVSETKAEVDDCVRMTGMTPVNYLDSIGLLGPDVVAAHCVWLDRQELDLMAERGVTIAHCPCSNMKLGSGRFPYREAIASGVRITLATDGCASNNNLDMREEMKFAALLSKVDGDVECLPAGMVLEWATRNGAEVFGIDGGMIAEGKVADCLLIDMDDFRMKPNHNLIANWVYAASSDIINTVICDGRVIFNKQRQCTE